MTFSFFIQQWRYVQLGRRAKTLWEQRWDGLQQESSNPFYCQGRAFGPDSQGASFSLEIIMTATEHYQNTGKECLGTVYKN